MSSVRVHRWSARYYICLLVPFGQFHPARAICLRHESPMLPFALLLSLLLASQDEADEQFRTGQFGLAAESYARRVEANEADAQAWYRLGFALHALGRMEAALAAHERAADFPGPTQSGAAYNAACANAMLGNTEPALDRLEQAVEFGFGSATQLELDTDLDSLRDSSRFDAVFRKLVHADTFQFLRALPKGSSDQFDFWVGEWNTEVWMPTAANGWTPSGKLTMKVERVAGGQALVEWAEGSMGGGTTLGFSLRSYDPAHDCWTLLLNWSSPGSPTFSSLRGGFRHGRGELVTPPSGAAGAITQTKFTFSDKDSNHLRWDGSSTADNGMTWNTDLLFEFTRRGEDAAPLSNGPSKSNNHAAGARFRELDFLLGSWSGVRLGSDGVECAVEIDVTSVMEGSALTIERSLILDAGERNDSFAIAAFDPGRGAWVAYEVIEGNPRFERHEGLATGESIRFHAKAGPGSSGSESGLRWIREGEQLNCERVAADGAFIWRELLTRRE